MLSDILADVKLLAAHEKLGRMHAARHLVKLALRVKLPHLAQNFVFVKFYVGLYGARRHSLRVDVCRRAAPAAADYHLFLVKLLEAFFVYFCLYPHA